jgi:hypothetical protein
MKVLVTASRYWLDRTRVWALLDAYAVEAGVRNEPLEVIHGDCPTGGDWHARLWCEERTAALALADIEVRERRFPAKWKEFGSRAGFMRNQVMVDLMPDVCLAFMRLCADVRCPARGDHLSHGAADTVARCLAADIPVRKFEEV